MWINGRYKRSINAKIVLIITVAGLLLSLIIPSTTVYAQTNASRIINGKTVPPGKYPWMVSLLYGFANEALFDFTCGGTLIERQWVLTAAHCVNNVSPELLSISVNSVNLARDEDIERIPVAEILLHSSFTRFGYRDVALLRLERKVARNIPTLKLIDRGTTLDIGTKVTVMGWGNTSAFGDSPEHTQGISRRLKETDLEIDHQQICDNYWTPFMPEHELCLASPTRDSIDCFGDSGGPSIIKHDATGEYYQVGIVSWGDSSCDTHYGSVHTKISSISKWISRQIANRPLPYETVKSVRPVIHYCDGLTCVFDVSNYAQWHSLRRLRWNTSDGARLTGDTVFQHRFGQAGNYEVRMVANKRDGSRIVEKLKVYVKGGAYTGSDSHRYSNDQYYLSASTTDDSSKLLIQGGQGTWFYDGPASFTLRNYSRIDVDLELWRYDFDLQDWQLHGYSANPGDSPERIKLDLTSGFYHLNVLNSTDLSYVSLNFKGQLSRRHICARYGPLQCRPGVRKR